MCANETFSHIFDGRRATLGTVGFSDTPGGEQLIVLYENEMYYIDVVKQEIVICIYTVFVANFIISTNCS